MRTSTIAPTGHERFFPDEEIIVSKTDLKGRITYANKTFLEISDYTEEELLGKAHNIIRHPHMPRCVFKLLWDTLQSRQEIFAFVKNMAKNGDHYWVFAHVTPSFDGRGNIMGYHSNRRVPERSQVQLFENVYAKLLREENAHAKWEDGMASAERMLLKMVAEKKMDYEEFVFAV